MWDKTTNFDDYDRPVKRDRVKMQRRKQSRTISIVLGRSKGRRNKHDEDREMEEQTIKGRDMEESGMFYGSIAQTTDDKPGGRSSEVRSNTSTHMYSSSLGYDHMHLATATAPHTYELDHGDGRTYVSAICQGNSTTDGAVV